MPVSVTQFATLRGDRITTFQGRYWPQANYQYIKTVAIGAYKTKGESITWKYTTAPPDRELNTEYIYTFEENYDTRTALNKFNYHDANIGFTLEDDQIENTALGYEGSLRFSEGIANRLGYDPGVWYDFTYTTPIYTPLIKEPSSFRFYYNDQLTAVIPGKNSTFYEVTYQAFMKPELKEPTAKLTDEEGNVVYIPTSFQVTEFKGKSVNFRKLGVSNPRTPTHSQISTSPGQSMAIRQISVDDSQVFTGDESFTIRGFKVNELPTGVVIDSNYNLTDLPETELTTEPYTHYIIYYYDKTTTGYKALPVRGTETEPGVYVDFEILPEFTQIPPNHIKKLKPYKFEESTGALDLYHNLKIVTARKGPYTEQFFNDLYNTRTEFDADMVASVNSDNYITINAETGYLLSIETNSEKIKRIFKGMGVNGVYNGDFSQVKEMLTTPMNIYPGSSYPSFYKMRTPGFDFTFSSGTTRYIEWIKDFEPIKDMDLELVSYTADGKSIRTLGTDEWWTTVIMRYNQNY